MNTLVAVAIAPCGTGEELSAEVAEVIRVIRASGLPNRTNSMFTEIEGEWDEVMRVVKDGAGRKRNTHGGCAEGGYKAGLY